MKYSKTNKIISAFICCLAYISFSGCSQKAPEMDYRITVSNELASPEDDSSFDLSSVKNVKFAWTESKATDGCYVIYDVLMALPDGDFANPVIRFNGNDKPELQVKAANIAAALESIGASGPEITLKWTVSATKGLGDNIYSESRTVTFIL